jgi:hypothetical protein
MRKSMDWDIDTSDPRAVAGEVQSLYMELFPDGDRLHVPRVFGWAVDCFNGRYSGYQAIDIDYHDFEHTLQVTLCMVRLIYRRHLARALPIIDRRHFQLGLLAILLHDTGYLKKSDDTEGTGAKYTLTHVNLSGKFAAKLMAEKGYPPEAAYSVKNMIHCTGVNVALADIPFASPEEELLGLALGTADYLGQMSARNYVDKLPELYSEFEEAARNNPGKAANVGSFASVEDLLRKTPAFWEYFVLPKLKNDFKGLYRFLNNPQPDGPNIYVQRVEENMASIRKRIAGLDEAAPSQANG